MEWRLDGDQHLGYMVGRRRQPAQQRQHRFDRCWRAKEFGRYIEFLQAFSIPWAVIADGPALHPTSDLYQPLKAQGLLSAAEPDSADPIFGEWKTFWETHGVFSVADVFGNDGSEARGFEAYPKRLDLQLLSRVGEERSNE